METKRKRTQISSDRDREYSVRFYSHRTALAAFSTKRGVETVMATNLLIKVEFWCDRIFMRLKPA